MIHDKRLKFGDPRLNHSREIPPEAVGGGIFEGSKAKRPYVMTGVRWCRRRRRSSQSEAVVYLENDLT